MIEGTTQDVNIIPNIFEKKAPTVKSVIDSPEKFDYIVVGCGAAGCPVAGYLANQGNSVLLIERGPVRSHDDTPNAVSTHGAGMGIADPSISQPISTRNGVITHVGAVMGGGTSISLGIYIEEPWSFFEYLNRVYDAGWEESLFRKAHKEVQKIFGDDVGQYVTPNDTRFGPAVGEALWRQGYEPLGGRLPAQASPGIKFSNKDGFRMASDFFVSRGYLKKGFRKNLTVRTNNFVERVEWERDANGPIARCVIYHKTTPKDTRGHGNLVRVPHASSSSSKSWINAPRTSYHTEKVKKTEGCLAANVGQVSGARVAEGVIYATRFILPPLYRSDPVADALFETLQACSEHREPFGIALLKPLCAVAYPIIKCFRQVYAKFYYTAQPKSRGTVRLSEDGKLEVNSNHLQHEEDLFDAVRGVSTLLHMANQNTYKKVVQDNTALSCPATILNGLLDLMTTIGSTSTVFLTKPTNFYLIQNHLQDLIPPKHRRLRRIVKLDGRVKPRKLQGVHADGDTQTEGSAYEFEDYSDHVLDGLDLETMDAVGIKKRLEEIGFDFDSYVKHLKAQSEANNSNEATEVFLGCDPQPESATHNFTRNSTIPCSAPTATEQQHSVARNAEETVALRQAVEECREDCSSMGGDAPEPFCPAADVCCSVFGNSKCFSTAAERREKMSALLNEATHSKITRQYLPEIPFPGQPGTQASGMQWAASYPPLLPNPRDAKAVAKYALSYMSSIWHHANTVPMGKIVDKNFDLIGAKRLSVIDSSVLNELPRMNPTATMLMLGIYGGMVKQRQRMAS
ncbi:putative mandelonitrile lyase [Toxoplasma gondii TgCatPRC2]|uniref:Putative mandelonitrile lyase n=1 Tax=Toxoplasma gondii TgCatPRC2 TaxID=1130821 RepID=A0A151HDU5_TOXGO|nr:putative mandelonitrile lyase [Toxoplasma gondii TgCatPRC2]